VKRFIVAVAFGAIAQVSTAQQLTPSEHKLTASVDGGTVAAIALLERAVNINSGTLNLKGVRAVGDVFDAEFRKLGFTTRWVEGASWGRAGHLIATWKGNGRGPKILLIGHLDTVFEADSPFQKFERVHGDSAHGPGTADMKGGDVVMLLALRALKDAGELDGVQITAVLHGDEEFAGRPISLSRKDLREAADWADIAMGFENGPDDANAAVTARRGSTDWVLRTSGVTAHSSQLFQPQVGSGAIYEMARILTAFHDSLSKEDRLTFNPGVVVGGTTVTFDAEQRKGTAFGKTNVVADSASVAGDIRALTPEQLTRAEATMQRIAARHYPKTGATLTFDEGYPPLAGTPGNSRLLGMLDRASRDAGLPPVTSIDPIKAGAADISFVAGRVDMAIDGLGMKGRDNHANGETADLKSLSVQAKRAAILLSRLAKRPAAQ
jgi:glutamate carboxypeptidase